MVDKTKLPLENIPDKYLSMTKEQARQVKQWRVDELYGWRGVAGNYYDEYGIGDSLINDNQIDGMEICCVAAYVLGEDYMDENWN
jgi:hypothetical protein